MPRDVLGRLTSLSECNSWLGISGLSNCERPMERFGDIIASLSAFLNILNPLPPNLDGEYTPVLFKVDVGADDVDGA